MNDGRITLFSDVLRARALAYKTVKDSTSLSEALDSIQISEGEDHKKWIRLINKAWSNQEYMVRVIKEIR